MTATSDTLQNSTVTETNAAGSDALTAKSRLATALVRANTLRIPSANPTKTGGKPGRQGQRDEVAS
jgi:hypothetical protein